jgi:hypothetical protein
MKRVAKSFVLFIASSLYVTLLISTATSIASFFILKGPEVPKQWLEDSGVYTNIVGEVSKMATIQQKQENSLVQITSEDIQLTAKQSFPPETLQADMEGLMDGFYGWFRGETTGPVFSVDFSGRQATFAAAMTNKLEQKINGLPECENTGRFTVQAFDPFKADCRPKGIDLTEELTSFEKEIASSKDILPQVTYTGDDVKIKDGNGELQRVATALPWVPNAYRVITWGPWALAALTLLAALTMIFLSTSRRKGVRRVASGLIFTGIVLILSGLFLRPAFERLNGWSTSSLGTEASFTQNIVDPVFREINITYSRYSVIAGIVYTIPALVIYAALILTRHKKGDEQVVEGEGPAISDTSGIKPQMAAELTQAPVLSATSPQAEVEPAIAGIPVQSPAAPVPQPRPIPQEPSVRTYERRPPMIQG